MSGIMFQDVDEALRVILSAAPDPVGSAEVDFVSPEHGYGPSHPTLNLFLYDVKENRELRDPVPIDTRANGLVMRRRPPLRMDCAYLVTAWTGADAGAAQQIEAEHRLLGRTLAWLSRFAEIPVNQLTGDLAGQPFAPPMWVAQTEEGRDAGEFWSALGIAPRPAFNLMVTIALDLQGGFDAPMVTTLTARSLQIDRPNSAEDRATIGGVVRDAAGAPVPRAWVRLEPPAPGQLAHFIRADGQGRFVFSMVAPGIGYALRARATGFAEVVVPIDVPSPSGDYIVQFV